MGPRIAIPMPHSSDPEYAERAIPQYERAVALAGGEPVRVRLDQSPDEVRKVIELCDGVLLPGSNADVDPARFHAPRSPHTAAADPRRDAVDDLLLEDAYQQGKPVLGICYGLQSLNVYHAGSLVQHIPDFLPEAARAKVDHEAGKSVAVAHTVEIVPGSRLAQAVNGEPASGAKALGDAKTGGAAPEARPPQAGSDWGADSNSRAYANPNEPREGKALVLPVNSSHHQSAGAVGKGLLVVARCPDDGIIEALEGTETDHFVLAVQWHPERSVEQDAASRAIFRAFMDAASQRRNKFGHG